MSDPGTTGLKEDIDPEPISTSLDVEQLDTNLYRSKSLWVPRRSRGVFGGQVISQALVAATNSVDPSFALHSLHCYFILGASASIPIIYFVERTRQGRTYATRSVKASQFGKIVFIMLCSFQKPELFQPSHQLSFPLDVPPPGTIEPEEVKLEALAREAPSSRLRGYYEKSVEDRRNSPIDLRLAGERTDPEGGYVIMWWMKLRKARGTPNKTEQPFQKCILAYISDINFTPWRALGFHTPKGSRNFMSASLDHSIFYYNHDLDCSEWLLYVMTSPSSGHGRGMALGRIYTEAGALVAVTIQEGLVRIRRPTQNIEVEGSVKANL